MAFGWFSGASSTPFQSSRQWSHGDGVLAVVCRTGVTLFGARPRENAP